MRLPHAQRACVARALTLAGLALAAGATPAGGQGAADSVTAMIENAYTVTPNVVYRTVGNVDLHVDVYQPRRAAGPVPTLLYFFGGGWVTNSKERAILRLLPWLARGWAVVNVEYRLARTALAPAAVEDARCALFWIGRNAAPYRFDTTRIVTSGHSAGGHLALMAGMAPRSAGFERECAGYSEPPRVAAIVSWYGLSVVSAAVDGPANQDFASRWLGNQPDREGIAQRVSPLTYVRAGLPPVMMIHGDADDTVPYTTAIGLQQALQKAGVVNQLLTIPRGGHGGWTTAQWMGAERDVDRFLSARGVAVSDSLRRVIFSLP